MATRKYGWIPELPDHRDYKFAPTAVQLPSKVSLRAGMPPVYNQGQLGSCTANALAAQLDYMRGKQGEAFITPSRLFIYYNERVIENSVSSDAGAMGRDGIKTLKHQGVCSESAWPYDIAKFAIKPPAKAYTDALKYESLTYKKVAHTSINNIKSALALGLPISFGFTVYDSFESAAVAESGVVPMPSKSENVLGGHETVIVGYDDSRGMAEVRNSWGPSWGDHGYFWMPCAYLTGGLASDFWVIETVK